MVHGGVALARLEGGRVALVAGALPGERVVAELEPARGVLMGRAVEILEASADRVEPPRHPGLDYGHIRYERQLSLKREVVADALHRACPRAQEVPPVRPAPLVWGYRSAVQPAVGRTGLGYREGGSHRIVELDEDPVANEALAAAWRLLALRVDALRGVREIALRGNDEGETLAALVATSAERELLPLAHELVREGLRGVAYARFDPRGRFRRGSSRLAGARTIRQRYGAFDLSVSPSSFAQPSPAAAGALLEELVRWLPGGGRALDLYAGGGAVAFHLALRFREVTALEIDRSASVRGERDAARLGLDGVRFVRADARRAPLPDGVELIAADPPRAGLSAALRQRILESRANRLIYVSCDPATWARDVAAFEAGGLRLARFAPFDFYPHTHHIELLSLLER